MGADGAASLVRGLCEAGGDAAAVDANRFDDLAAARADPVDDVVGVGADGARHGERGLRQPVGHAVTVADDRLRRLGARLDDAADHVVGMGADRAAGQFGGVPEARCDVVAMSADRVDDRGLRGVDAGDQVVAARVHVVEQDVARHPDAVIDVSDPFEDVVGGFLARFGEPGCDALADADDRDGDLRPFGGDALDRGGAGAAHRGRDVFRRGAERDGDAPPRLGQAIA